MRRAALHYGYVVLHELRYTHPHTVSSQGCVECAAASWINLTSVGDKSEGRQNEKVKQD